MLRSKGFTDKMILLGVDGMDPQLTKKFMDEGKMPNVKKVMELGACREDLMLLGGVPTVTPPMWATLATGAYPMTHGITDFHMNYPGELDFNFNAIYSNFCKAEQLWNVTAEAGLKTLVWHWPGASWPPSSDSENLYVVDGTSAGAIGFGSLRADFETVAVASDNTKEPGYNYGTYVDLSKINGDPKELKPVGTRGYSPIYPKGDYFDEYAERYRKEVGDFNGYEVSRLLDFRVDMLVDSSQMNTLADGQLPISYSPFYEPEGWAGEVPEGAKEFKILFLFGKLEKPCLLLKNEEGIYDRVAFYTSKQQTEPNAIIVKQDALIQVPDYTLCFQNGKMVNAYRNMRIMELAEDGSMLKLWCSDAMDLDNKSVFHPQWIHDEIYEHIGNPAPTSLAGSHDMDISFKCAHAQWEQAAMWQAEALKYMMDEKGVNVIFSHYHGPDLEGHSYMKYIKTRSNSPQPEEVLYKRLEATYTLTDKYIGQFIPYIEKGYVLNIFSDHGLVCRQEENHHYIGDGYGINTGVLARLGYTALTKTEDGHTAIDWANTRAIQQRLNEIYINLKGRDRFGIVDPADKYELEEQIITDLYGYKDEKTGKRVISLALHNKDAVLLGMGGEHSADIIFFVHEDYNFDHGESLSTAQGYADTTTSPLYLIAGPGVKENYRVKGYIREVDVTPTAAVLLGVDIPAQCEGAPAYQIFTEKL